MLPKKTSICSADISISEKEALRGQPIRVSLLENDKHDEPRSIKFLNYYKGFLDFGFFCLIVPFRLKLSEDSLSFQIHTNTFQKIACAITQILVFYDYISSFHNSSWNNSEENPINYLTSASYLGYIAYSVAINYAFWWKKSVFHTLFERFQNIKFYCEGNARKVNFVISALSYGVCIGVFIMSTTDSALVEDYIKHGNITRYYQKLSNQAQRYYLFNSPNDNSTLDEPNCILVFLVTSIKIFVLFPALILVPFLDFFALIIPLSMWHFMKEFKKFCKNTAGCPVAADKIYAKYWKLKKLMRVLNAATGSIMFCVIATSLPYYAAWSGITFFLNDIHFILMFHFYTFFFVFFLVLTAAADVNKKGTEFFCWVTSPENSEGISPQVMASLLVDLHTNQIALKGAGFFVMTYRFLGTIFGVIVTYSIITIQIQISRQAQNCNQTVVVPESQLCNCTLPYVNTDII